MNSLPAIASDPCPSAAHSALKGFKGFAMIAFGSEWGFYPLCKVTAAGGHLAYENFGFCMETFVGPYGRSLGGWVHHNARDWPTPITTHTRITGSAARADSFRTVEEGAAYQPGPRH